VTLKTTDLQPLRANFAPDIVLILKAELTDKRWMMA
jgi:hypothetical protein